MHLLSITLLAALLLARPTPDILIADFEGENYGDWIATGSAFGSGPAHGTLPHQNPVSGFRGRGLVNSFYGGDDPTGILTSPEFSVQRRFINFLVGGGGFSDETCINLLLDGKVVRTATGAYNEMLEWYTWDVAYLAGKRCRIQIVDKKSGGWGHINVDEIAMSDVKRAVEINRDRLYDETYRPQFHFTAKRGWLNDPNGLVYYKGRYHLFFQHNPEGNQWGNMTWGHAVSSDLLHWQQVENAIERDALGTIFSGSAAVDWHNTAGFGNEALVAMFTAAGGTSDESKGRPFTQRLAYSTDSGNTWSKVPEPVLPNVIKENRDPKIVWHSPTKRWIMALYLDGNEYGLFASPDLKQWHLLHKLTMPDCSECPDFFPMGNKWVFTSANGRYFIGDFDGQKFTPSGGVRQVEFGANCYAVQTYSDEPRGRRIQMAWMNGGAYPEMPFNQQMAFPCELTLTDEGLRKNPIREISKLRGPGRTWKDVTLYSNTNPLSGLSGELWDIEAVFEVDEDVDQVGLMVRGEPVVYNAKEQKLTALNRSAPLNPIKDRIKIRVLVDRTSLEVYGNDGRVALTSCFLPHPNERSLEVFAKGDKAKLESLVVYSLRRTWPGGK